MDRGAMGALMSGSGPTVFAIFNDEETAEKAFEDMKNVGLARQVFLTGVKNRGKRFL